MTLSRTERQRSLIGVIAAMAVVNLVYGMTFPLLALVLDAQGVSKTLIGLNTIIQAAAIFAIAPLAPGWLRRFSPARMMLISTAVMAVMFILTGLFPNVWFWFPLRFVIGALTAVIWISSESLINELAGDRRRGRVIGIYTSVGAAGFALGPLLLILTGSEGMLPFYSITVLVLATGMPLLMVRGSEMGHDDKVQGSVWTIFLLAPTIMLTNVVYAASAESMITFFPLFGLHLGLSENFALGLMTIMGAGGMILVLPLGWLADHVNKMGLLVACILLTMAGLLAMPWLIQQPLLATVFAFVFGGVEGMIYAMGVMLVGQQFKGAMLAAATTAFTTSWAAGTVVGPLVVGAGMDRFGAEAMALIIFLFFAAYAPLPVVAWIRQARAPG
jgi:MFS family permease